MSSQCIYLQVLYCMEEILHISCIDVVCMCSRTAVCFTCDRVEHPEEPVWLEADGGVDLQEGSELN